MLEGFVVVVVVVRVSLAEVCKIVYPTSKIVMTLKPGTVLFYPFRSLHLRNALADPSLSAGIRKGGKYLSSVGSHLKYGDLKKNCMYKNGDVFKSY